jgi:opacity protein-like surface antigen
MKIMLALAVLAALATSAAAKPSLFEPRAAAPAVDDESVLYLGPVGAMLESDYFRVPQPPAGAGRVFPCRVRLHAIGRKPGFTQACD